MTEPTFELVKRDDLRPVCPHCEKDLDQVYYRAKGIGWVEGRDVAFFCPSCRKVLGFGQSRMM